MTSRRGFADDAFDADPGGVLAVARSPRVFIVGVLKMG